MTMTTGDIDLLTQIFRKARDLQNAGDGDGSTLFLQEILELLKASNAAGARTPLAPLLSQALARVGRNPS